MSARGSLLEIVDAASEAGRAALGRLVDRGADVLDREVMEGAREIVEAVRAGGDGGLVEKVRRFDGVEVSGPEGLRLDPGPVEELKGALPDGFAEALEVAIEQVEAFHRPQVHPGYEQSRGGVFLEERRTPLERVGVYVPGGLACYPSTVVMTVVPARLAGVPEVVVATPPAAFEAQATLRYTLARLGVDEVWGMGGAQAVAALAHGTETIRRVDKIVGPGNAWVTAAKVLVQGRVAVDGVAGPSEVLIVADSADPEVSPAWIAADLLAQAEHDPRAAAVLVTDRRSLAEAVAEELADRLPGLASGARAGVDTEATARASLGRFGIALVVGEVDDGWAAALELIETIAPEHLQLVGARAEALAPRVRAAGAIFVGAATPEVLGDYVAGPSHVLPTCGSARFASALGVEDFVRRSHLVRCTPEASRRLARAAAVLADAEGLPAHAASARCRLERGRLEQGRLDEGRLDQSFLEGERP